MRNFKKRYIRIFLFINLFFISFAIAFFLEYKKAASPSVLQAAVVNLTRISNYDLDFRDLDGATKSLIPADCQNFNFGFMSTTCNRNMAAPSTFWPSPTYSYASNGFFLIGFGTGTAYTSNAIALSDLSKALNFNIFRSDFKRYRPILDEVDGIPVLSYYGGLYEINRANGRAYLLTRYFNTGARYSKACNNEKVPQNLYKVDYRNTTRNQTVSTFIYGMSGVSNIGDYTYTNCTKDEFDAYQAGTGTKPCYKCNNFVSYYGCAVTATQDLGIPEALDPTFRARTYVTPWRSEYECKNFSGGDFNYNSPQTHQIEVVRCKTGETCTNNGALTVIAKRSQLAPKSAGFGFDDFRASCVGKSDNGSCNEVILSKAFNDYVYNTNELIFSYLSKLRVLKNSTGTGTVINQEGGVRDANGFSNNFDDCYWEKGLPSPTNCFVNNPLVTAENTKYPSYTSMFEPFVNYTFGYETPFNSTYKAIDFNSNGFVSKIPKLFNTTSETGDPAIPNPTIKTPSNLPGAANTSFATDDFIFSIFANTSSISVFRYSVKDQATAASLKFTDYFPEFRSIKDISVAVSKDGSDVVDIMFSSRPSSGFNQSRTLALGPVASDLRVYRIYNALSTNPLRTLRIEDISSKFNLNFNGARVYPISFKRYYDSTAKRDYYVYVTSDQIYTSEVPPVSGFICNVNKITITNTSPLSILNGLATYSPDGVNNIDFRLGAPFACDGDPTILPSEITLRAFDPITNAQIGGVYTTTLDPDKLNFSFFLDDNFVSSKKYNFELTFVVEGENLIFNSVTKPGVISRGYFFSFESSINFEVYDVFADGTSQPSYDTVLTYSKNGANPASLTPLNSSFTVGSEDVGGFNNAYFDHNLERITGGQLDSISNTFCFGDKVIKSISSDTPNFSNLINTSLTSSNKCLETVYKASGVAGYGLNPVTIKVYFNIPSSPPEASLSNFEINGNLFSRIDIGKVIRTFPNLQIAYQGNYISGGAISSSNVKTFNNSTLNLSTYSPLPSFLQGYSIPSGNILNSTNLSQFNLVINTNVPESNVIYSELKPGSLNEYEIIVVSKGKGIKIDLNNTNLLDPTFSFDKYILINLDKSISRISFNVDCGSPNYTTICTPGTTFYFKGLVVGKFDIDGKVNTGIKDKKFINLAENSDLFMFLLRDIREDKKPLVNTTKINLKYIN